MHSVLLLLDMPPQVQRQYYEGLKARFPDLQIDLAERHDRVDPYIGRTEILITFAPMLRDEIIGKAKNLRWVQALGTGVDNLIDLPSLGSEVIVTNIRGIHGTSMSEAAIMAMLALTRDFPRIIRHQDRHEWQRWPARIMEGKTIGILGIGSIGEALAQKCKALGMKVIGITSSNRGVGNFDRIYNRAELALAVREVDYLIVLTPYSDETRNIVHAGILAAMKPSAYLVNLARGGIVHEGDLIEALENNTIAGAALDVFNQEPLPKDHPFWSMSNVIVMPHAAGFNDEYADQALPVIETNIQRYMAGDFSNMLNVIRRSGSSN